VLGVDVAATDVVEVGVVALADDTVHAGKVRVTRDEIPNQGVRDERNVESVRQENRRLDDPELGYLRQANGLAEAIQDKAGRLFLARVLRYWR
jgi:hypothetical protein